MTPIAQDPARRIRRIQRWFGGNYKSFPRAPVGGNPKSVTACDLVRLSNARHLFAAELAWLCEYAKPKTCEGCRHEGKGRWFERCSKCPRLRSDLYEAKP